jgi:hypothetical protein
MQRFEAMGETVVPLLDLLKLLESERAPAAAAAPTRPAKLASLRDLSSCWARRFPRGGGCIDTGSDAPSDTGSAAFSLEAAVAAAAPLLGVLGHILNDAAASRPDGAVTEAAAQALAGVLGTLGPAGRARVLTGDAVRRLAVSLALALPPPGDTGGPGSPDAEAPRARTEDELSALFGCLQTLFATAEPRADGDASFPRVIWLELPGASTLGGGGDGVDGGGDGRTGGEAGGGGAIAWGATVRSAFAEGGDGRGALAAVVAACLTAARGGGGAAGGGAGGGGGWPRLRLPASVSLAALRLLETLLETLPDAALWQPFLPGIASQVWPL